MIQILKSIFNKSDTPDGHDTNAATNSTMRFVVKIGDLEISYLEFRNTLWIFQYSEAFKEQKKYTKITGFSDLGKVYQSEILWPFFKIRIPGLKQPMIKEIIAAENIDTKDEAFLLKRFGRKNISNPYILEPA